MSKSDYPSQTADKFMLRLPDGMRQSLKDAAHTSRRSINAEIIHRLSTWREPKLGGLSTSSIAFDVDTTEITEALGLVKQLAESAKEAFAACEKLGIKIGGQP